MAIVKVIQREWQRLLHQPTYWAVTILLPVLVLTCVAEIIKVPQVHDVTMDVVDEDRSAASRELLFRLDSSSTVSIGQQLLDTTDALERAKNKDSFGYLHIPEGFNRSLATGEQVQITAYVNQQSFMMGNILGGQVIRNVLESSLQETAVHLMTTGALTEQALAQVVPLSGKRSVLGNSHLNYQSFLLASMLPHIWHVFVMLVTVIAVGHEFKSGTAGDWIRTADDSIMIALLGKLAIPGFILALWIAAIDIYVANITGLAPYANLPALIFSGWVTQISYHCAGILAVALTHNYRLSISITAFYTAPAFAFVGVTFPTFDMNSAAQLWQSLLPVSLLIQIQNAVLHWGANMAELWPTLANIGVYTLVFSLPALTLLRRKVHDPQYWHKH